MKRKKKSKRWIAGMCAAVMTTGVLAGCGGDSSEATPEAAAGDTGSSAPFRITLATAQVGDVPAADNEVEKAIESYTNTQLDIQWIPSAAYDEKVNVMVAADEMPMMLRVKYVPTTISSIQSDLFWEVGPLLGDYKNLSALNKQYYENISVDGKIYGIPQFRDIARSAVIYREDWLKKLGMKPPVTVDEWYNVLKAMTLNDPDGNGKNDTYGMVLGKKYNEGVSAMTTRMAVALGAPNKWAVDSAGKFTPEFVTPEFNEILKLFRKLFAEKLINQDFAAFEDADAEKMYDSGRVGIRIAVAQNAKSMQDRLSKTVPDGIYDVMPPTGPKGVRAAGESGNNGFFVFPKSKVKNEAELKKLLAFADKMLDEPMATLQLRGVEGKHYTKVDGGKTEFKDFSAFQREVKPYRDSLFNVEGFNVAPLKDTPLGEKGTKIPPENLKTAVLNPALNLTSATYSERGKELEQMMYDAQTKYIMGKIDDAGLQAEIEKWRKAGGDQVAKEYEATYAKLKK
ncbi:putative aldouronate transport system substrate-binding protein [Paenibacillus mucilaginosus]|uniref:extracellular solute-binding protein n=1 Tax=Paenibacillus mucilaginosus TaxID=61624 RepID=UPI003D251AD8